MMSNKQSLTRKTIAIALAAGIGFGGVTFNPVLPTTQVEAAASRYSTDQLKALATLNEYRKQAGMKPVTLDPLLTKAATNHYNYLNTNGFAYGHDEVKGHKGFTGSKVKDRVKAVGGSVGVSLSENIVFVAKNSPNSIFQLVHNAPLHRESLLDPDATSVGIESQKGTQSGVQVIVVRVDDYVQRETDHVYPTPNASEVVPLFAGNEIPDPLEDFGIEQSGHILTYWYPSEAFIYEEKDFSFVLKDSKGNVVPSFVDFRMNQSSRLIPKKMLKYNEKYTATVKWYSPDNDQRGGRTWSFTTQAISTEPVKPGTPVDVVKESKDYTLIKGQPLYASNSTSSKQLVQIPTNGKVRSIEKRSSWMKVTYNGKTGFVAAKNLKPYVAPKTVGMYATKDVKAYATRSAKGKVSFTVPRGKKVERLAVDGSWAQVKYGSKTGWVASSHLKTRYTKETFVPRAYQVKEEVPLQATHATNGKVLTSLPKEIIIASAERYNSWYKVTFNKKTGWVNGKYLTPYKAPTAGPSKPKPEEPPVNVDSELKEKARAIFGNSYKYISESKNEVFVTKPGTYDGFHYADRAIFSSLDNKFLLKVVTFVTDLNGGDPKEIMKIMKISDPQGRKYGEFMIYRHSSGDYSINW